MRGGVVSFEGMDVEDAGERELYEAILLRSGQKGVFSKTNDGIGGKRFSHHAREVENEDGYEVDDSGRREPGELKWAQDDGHIDEGSNQQIKLSINESNAVL
jgi:hypothetical protein